MAPETRSTHVRPAEPSSSSKTYSSALPSKQQRFSTRRKTVKTYGKSRRSAPPRMLRQQTLTQMIDIDPPPSIEPDDELPIPVDDGPKNKKRRKTMGDSPNLSSEIQPRTKTEKTPSSSFHTQTLTQFVRDRTLPVKDSDDEDDFDLMDIESPEKPGLDDPEDTTAKLMDAAQPATKTPSKTIKTEIPASTPSVFSPMLDRYSPPDQRSSPTQLRSQRQPSGARSGSRSHSRPLAAAWQKTPERKTTRTEIPPSNESIGTPIGAAELLGAEIESPLAGKSTNTPVGIPELSDGTPRTPTMPSTQAPVPASPKSVASAMLDRYSPPGPRRSPLKEKSANASMAPASSARRGKCPRDLEAEDSFYPKHSPGLKSALKKTPGKHTPGKRTRFILPPEEQEEATEQDSQKSSLLLDNDDESDFCPESPSPKPRVRGKSPAPAREIPDSDDESGWGDDAGEATRAPAEQAPSEGRNTPEKQSDPAPMAAEETQDNYGEIGEETQAFVDSAISSATQNSSGSTSGSKPVLRQSPRFKTSPPIPRSASRIGTLDSLPPILKPTRKLKPRPIQGTQFESQRLSMELVRQMASNRAQHADVFVSIHPEEVDRIVDSTKNHEFRNYRFPESVSRLWIYATKPVGELRYMAHVGPPKQPGDIVSERGLGNEEFNSGNGARFAYEILQVYELNNPVSLEDMKAEGWINAPPQRYTHVPPAVMGELVGNLRCDLFEDGELEEVVDVGIRVSQEEVEARIRSDVAHPSQLVPGEEEVIPSSHKSERVAKEATPRPVNQFAPLVGETPDEEEMIEETPRPHQRHSMMRPSQATTASQPSSQTQSPGTMHRQSLQSCSLPPSDDNEGSPLRLNPSRYSYGGSSEILSTSQMLPASLLTDMNPEIGDSEQEESEMEE